MTNWNEKLFNFGYLITDAKDVLDRNIGVDWNTWKQSKVGMLNIYLHPLQKAFSYSKDQQIFLLVGHAYNPFSMEKDETRILENLANLYGDSEEYYNYFDQLTGVFFYAIIDEKKVICTCDCSGMMGAYYAAASGKQYYSSHSQLIAEICRFNEDAYVSRLKKSKLFHLYGWYLPGDRSPYYEIRRIIPNTEVEFTESFKIHRFYPRKPYSVVSEKDYACRVAEIGQIIHNNMELVAKKWENPAVSLTGGTDSKTTLACTASIQDKFSYFSYVSLSREAVDAEAAKSICDNLGLNHTTYYIDTNKDHYPDYDEADHLIERHFGFLGKGKENDVCKRISLSQSFDYDIEVKSWVSEVARASRYGKYNKTKLPKRITPRRLTSMYKIFFLNRKAAMDTDRLFKEYISKTNLQQAVEENGYPWSEFFVWEIVFAGWGGLALTGEHKLTNDITVPYNNRALLDLMLRTPLEKRRTDALHHDIIRYMDHRIDDLGIHVVNGNETKLRAICEGLYFDLHSAWPW